MSYTTVLWLSDSHHLEQKLKFGLPFWPKNFRHLRVLKCTDDRNSGQEEKEVPEESR